MSFLFVCFSKGLKVIYKLRQSDIRYLRTLAQIRLSLSQLPRKKDMNKIKYRVESSHRTHA